VLCSWPTRAESYCYISEYCLKKTRTQTKDPPSLRHNWWHRTVHTSIH
jgi:hypothetical protein